MPTLCDKVLSLVSLPESERWTEDGRSDARCAVNYALVLREKLYHDLGLDNATLFAYALYGVLGRSCEKDLQQRAQDQLAVAKKAFPVLVDEAFQDTAGAIIRHYRVPLYDKPRSVSLERYALIVNADSGYSLRGIHRTYQAFINAPKNMFAASPILVPLCR